MNSLIASAASVLFGSVSAASEKVKTWGRNIKWVSLRDGQQLAKEQRKPAMIVFHKPWCRACKALRPRFANSRDIESLSSDFVMISVEEDDSPKSSDLSPDGAYIPRILFLDPSGNVMKHVTNKGAEGYRYYYNETKSSTTEYTHDTIRGLFAYVEYISCDLESIAAEHVRCRGRIYSYV